jgi:hypothetical protein
MKKSNKNEQIHTFYTFIASGKNRPCTRVLVGRLHSSRRGSAGWFSVGMVLSPDVMKDRSQCTQPRSQPGVLVERSTKFSTKYLVDLDLPRYSHVYSSSVHSYRSTKFTTVLRVVSGYSCVYTQWYKYSCL